MIINSRSSESGVPDLTDGVSLKVLQDTTEDDVFTTYGAEKWYFYVIDRQGFVHQIHYQLSLPTEEAKLLAEIAELQ